jgi:hypothetical protein
MKFITFLDIVRDGKKGFSKSESMFKYRLNPLDACSIIGFLIKINKVG